MSTTQSQIRHFPEPGLDLLGEQPIDLLNNIGGPAWLTKTGKDSSRRRAIVTLLHGNEPSGLNAIHQLLKDNITPATDIGVLIASVDAALYPPVLSHRYIPGEHDLNRCFGSDRLDSQSQLCRSILETLVDFSPEAVIDTHNTSSHSAAFSISVRNNVRSQNIATLFTESLIILDQKLGTLLEYLPEEIPALTVEFGGFMDPGADQLAVSGLRTFLTQLELANGSTETRILSHPLRLETQRKLTVTYSSSIDPAADLTIINTIDQLNFLDVDANTTLGWFEHEHHKNLVAVDAAGNDQYAKYFTQDSGILKTRIPMTIFMATTDPVVANTDCVLYFTPA